MVKTRYSDPMLLKELIKDNPFERICINCGEKYFDTHKIDGECPKCIQSWAKKEVEKLKTIPIIDKVKQLFV